MIHVNRYSEDSMSKKVSLIVRVVEHEILTLAEAKKMGLPPDATNEVKIERYQSLKAYQDVLDQITGFAEYVDQMGNTSTGAKGFSLQINRKIKHVFGKGVNEMSNEVEYKTLTAIRSAIANAISEGTRLNKSREEIKQRVYNLIRDVHQIYMGDDYWRDAA